MNIEKNCLLRNTRDNTKFKRKGKDMLSLEMIEIILSVITRRRDTCLIMPCHVVKYIGV
jgi:hypothetical protein